MSRNLLSVPAGSGSTFTTAAKTLRAATNRLRGGKNRWAKGDFHVGGGDCALGVIETVMAGKAMSIPQYNAMEAVLLQELKAMHPELAANTVADLNDDPAVTYEDVLAAFEKAALRFEEQVDDEIEMPNSPLLLLLYLQQRLNT